MITRALSCLFLGAVTTACTPADPKIDEYRSKIPELTRAIDLAAIDMEKEIQGCRRFNDQLVAAKNKDEEVAAQSAFDACRAAYQPKLEAITRSRVELKFMKDDLEARLAR